jgi:hypothetical protein
VIQLWMKQALVALTLLGAPSVAFSQNADPAQPSEAAQEIQALFNEMQTVGRQIGPMQDAVMADPEITAAQQAITAELELKMAEVDPMMNQQMARMRTLESEIATAQGAGNGDLFTQLMGERQAIQQRLMTVQESALADPTLAAKVTAFQQQVEAKIIETNPEAQALISRYHEIEELINQAMTGGV